MKTIKQWQAELLRAKKIKKQWYQRFRIALSYEYRDGIQRPSYVPESEWISINKYYSILKSELPTLYPEDPYFYIGISSTYVPDPAIIAEYERRAKIRQAMLNYIKKELDLKEKVKACILDAMFQFGVVKVHFSSEKEENPKKGQPIYNRNGSVMLDDFGEPMYHDDFLPVRGKYHISRIHPDDFYIDSYASITQDTWSWCAQRIVMPEYKFYKKYEVSKKIKTTILKKSYGLNDGTDDEIQRSRRHRNYMDSSSWGSYDNAEETPLVELYEIYDIINKKWQVIVEGHNEYIIKPESYPPGIEQIPFVILRLGLALDDTWLTIPPASQWIDVQRNFSELRSKIMTHRKRFNRKYTMYDDAFADPDTAAARLETGHDGTVLRQSQPGISVFPVQDAPLDSNYINEALMLNKDFIELAYGGNQMGAGAGIDSATEAGIIEKRTMIHESDKISAVMDFVKEIGKKIDQQAQANFTREEAIKVTGPQGEYWETVAPEDYDSIEGEYEYTINVGATMPHIPEIERSQWMAFLGMLASAPMLGLSKTLLKRVASMHHIEDDVLIDELYNIALQMSGGGIPQEMKASGSMPNVSDIINKVAATTGGMQGTNNIPTNIKR